MATTLVGNNKHVSQRLVDRITSGNFDDIDVRSLLFELREYSNDDSMFRELAHFIAHPDRNKGKFADYLISYSKKIKYFYEYNYNNKNIDLYKPFPYYIIECIINTIDHIDKTVLQKRFNSTSKILKKLIIKNTVVDKQDNTAYILSTAPIQIIFSIQYCFQQFFIQNEMLNQEIFIDNIIATLKKNNLTFNEIDIKNNSNKILLCILLLLHLRAFNIEDKNANKDLPYISILFDSSKYNIEQKYLGLYGIVNMPEFDNIKIAFPILTTNLLLTEYCDEKLLHDILTSNRNNEITRPLQFNNFKLEYSKINNQSSKSVIIFIFKKEDNTKHKMVIFSIIDGKRTDKNSNKT